MVRVSVASAALIAFYTLLLLVYTRPDDQRDAALAPRSSIEQPAGASAIGPSDSQPLRLRRLLSRNLSSTVEHWAASRIAAKQPVRLVVSGLTAAGTDWLAAVLRIILEEALAAHGPPVQVVTDACRANYCILNAARFAPDALAAADAVFTAHRDVRDVLLYMHAVGAVEKVGTARGTKLVSAFAKLEREFGVYRSWRAHACRDVRHEDVVSLGSAREIKELISTLGLQRSVDLLSVVRKVGQWTRTTQQQQQQQQQQLAGARSALYSLLVESVGVHRLVLGGPLQKETATLAGDAAMQADMRNVTASFGEWLTEQGFEDAVGGGGAQPRRKGVEVEVEVEGPLMRCPLGASTPAQHAAPQRPAPMLADKQLDLAGELRTRALHAQAPRQTAAVAVPVPAPASVVFDMVAAAATTAAAAATPQGSGCGARCTEARILAERAAAAVTVAAPIATAVAAPAAVTLTVGPPRQTLSAEAVSLPPPPSLPLPPPSPLNGPACYEFSPLSSTVYLVRFGCFVKRDEGGVSLRFEAQAKIAGRPYRYMSWGRTKYYGERAWYGLASSALTDHFVKEFEGCAVAEGPAHARELVSNCCPPPAWCPTSVDGLRWDDAPSEVTA